MPYTEGEQIHPDHMFMWLLQQTGVVPHTTEVNVFTGVNFNSYASWTTLKEETSGGPWMIMIARNNPSASTSIDMRVTVDGTLLATAVGLAPTTDNHFIGLPFGHNYNTEYGPVFARSSFKIEGKATVAGTYDIAYVGYSIT